MVTLSIPLERLKLDEAAQPRVELDDDYIEELANDLKAGSKFPPVMVFKYGEDYHLADGFHRYRAHQKAGIDKIVAEIRIGDQRKAIMHAVGANATHGKRRSNADKRKAVETLLKDDEWCRWSDRKIADVCRVSQPFVGTIRKEMTENGYKFPEKRISSNGRPMNTKKIGSNHPKKDETSEVEQQTAGSDETSAQATENSDASSQTEETQSAANQDEMESEASATATNNHGDESGPPGSDAGGESEEGDSPTEAQADKTPAGTEADVADQSSSGDKPTASGVDETNGSETPTMSAADIELLSQKVCDLEQALAKANDIIASKDKHIIELEEKVRLLEKDNEYYQTELTVVKDSIKDQGLPPAHDVESHAMETPVA